MYPTIFAAALGVLVMGTAGCSDDDEPGNNAGTPDKGQVKKDGGAEAGAPDTGADDQKVADAAQPDGTASACSPKCGFGFTCTAGKCAKDAAKKDHSKIITKYEGAKTCIGCHPKAMTQLMGSTHYKFSASLPANYMYDKAGKAVTHKYTGKNWKLCGFPTAFPHANWMGKLKDDSKTPHVDKPGGCGKCHIGTGMKPYTMSGATTPTAAEKAGNVDCLSCHAKGYSRKFYIATKNGKPELNASGAPMVFAVPRKDGKFDYSGQLAMAQAVGRSTSANCKTCHAKAGGGGQKIGNTTYSFKRGTGFSAESDVHAKAGMECATCHYNKDHGMIRAKNADLTAYDNIRATSGCVDCHGAAPHKSATYNKHGKKIACETCHATSKGGVTYKDFSKTVCPSGDCTSTSLNTYGVQMTKFDSKFKLTYAWFNGKVEKPIHPKGDKSDGKIYPFKVGSFNQPVDASENPIPVKWGLLFVKGSMTDAITKGRALYDAYLKSFKGTPAEYALPALPGVFSKYKAIKDMFSVSHGITKTGALTCTSCHSKSNSVLDWTKLGLTNPSPM